MNNAIMTNRQAAELNYAFERNGWTASDVKELIKGNNLAKILINLRGQIESKQASPLKFLGSIVVPARIGQFVARDHFIVNTSKKAKMKISYFGDRFSDKFLGKIEEPIAESTLYYGKLLRKLVDTPIINELGGEANAETTLSEMFGCMESQPSGEDGALLINGYANIFYIRDHNGVLWEVDCYWFDGGWCVGADSIEDTYEWDIDNQIFSHNPLVS